MKAKNLSHRFVAVLTFFIGLVAVLLWSNLSHFNKNQATNLETVGVLIPARVTMMNLDDDSTRVEISDRLMVITQPSQPSLTEPTELYPVDEDQDLIESNCGTIHISVDSNRNVSLNTENMGDLDNFSEVTAKLKSIFDLRAKYSGPPSVSNMRARLNKHEEESIYKTVVIKPSPLLTYGEVVRIIEMVKHTGAKPIAIYIRQ
jgi:hypothetical protein